MRLCVPTYGRLFLQRRDVSPDIVPIKSSDKLLEEPAVIAEAAVRLREVEIIAEHESRVAEDLLRLDDHRRVGRVPLVTLRLRYFPIAGHPLPGPHLEICGVHKDAADDARCEGLANHRVQPPPHHLILRQIKDAPGVVAMLHSAVLAVAALEPQIVRQLRVQVIVPAKIRQSSA